MTLTSTVKASLHSLQIYLLSFDSSTSRSLKTNRTDTVWPGLGNHSTTALIGDGVIQNRTLEFDFCTELRVTAGS